MENNLYDHYNEIPDFNEYEKMYNPNRREDTDWRSRLVKVIVIVCLMIFTVFTVLAGLKILAKSIKVSSYNSLDLAEELHSIESESKKSEPDGKAVLSDKYLTVKYKQFLSGRQNSAGMLDFFIYGLAGLVMFICLLTFVILYIGTKFDLKRTWKNLLPIPFIIAILIAYNVLGQKMCPPQPEEVKFYVGMYDFTRKWTKSIKDDDGDYSYKYYVYYKNDNGSETEMRVTQSEYENMKVPGKYYIASAVKDGMILEDWVFDTEKFKME